ncbi:hypothetical protein DE146DRAFT_416069 [Phaeosphaeria sp. MPI-PUGE-AT-0046c]|nr:hypothetical protein DE146DRAFT_416069 [Phaeosphaeria sp. MPI-PUGE-AT-0046c]
MVGCTESREYYQESGRYFGCSTIYTGCVNALPTGISSRGIDYCTSGSTCTTQTLHAAYPTSASESNQKMKPLCAPTGYNRIHLYRATTALIASTSSLRISSSASASSAFSASQTFSSTASSQTAAPPDPKPQPVSPGVIAGASIAGVALLLVLAFLIWFFGFHRRKQRKQTMSYQQDPAWNQQPEYVSTTYEVDGSQGRGLPGGYAPVQQHPPEAWKFGNTNQVSELPTEQYGRK